MLIVLVVVGTAVLVAPLPGLDPGIQPALKLAWLAALTLAIVARRMPLPRATRGELALSALAASAAMSTVVSGAELGSAIPVLVSLACLALLAAGARAHPGERWEDVETAALVAASAVAAVAVAELLGAHLPWAYLRRPESTLGNRNGVALYLALATPIVASAAARGRRGAAACLVLVVTVIVASHCRGAYLAVCAAAAAAWLPRLGRPRRLTSVLVAAGVGIALGTAPWPGVRFATSVEDSATRVFELAGGSGAARLHQHELGLRAMARYPELLGSGFGAGSWESVASVHAHDVGDPVPRVTGATVPNSELLRIAAEQGLLGLALAVTALVLAMRSQRPAGRAVLVAACVGAAVDPILVRPECVALLAVVIGAGDPTRAVAASRARALPLGLAAVAMALATLRAGAFVATAAGAPALAGFLVHRPALDERAALALAARGDCAEAAHSLDRFLAHRPAHWGARVAVARCFAGAGRPIEAARAWEAALALEPRLPQLVGRSARAASRSRGAASAP